MQHNYFKGKENSEIDKEFEQIMNFIPTKIIENKNINLYNFIE